MSLDPAVANPLVGPYRPLVSYLRRRRMSGFRDKVLQLAFCIVLLAAWEIVGRARVNLAFPPISAVATALVQMAAHGELAHAYASTLPPLVAGVSISAILGTAIGIAMGLSPPAEALFYPLFVLLQTSPVAAVIPLITEVMGVDMGAKTLAVVALSMPIVTLNAYKGIQGTSRSLLDMCRSFMGTRFQTIIKIVIPSASPMLFAGLRLGVSGGFIGIVLAELLITPTGVGDLISYNSSIAHYPEMYAAILSIVAVSTLTLRTMQVFERRITGGRAR
jgi:ABC-type nitrate/sulfonate/bicarbonate transport system permease component